MSVHARHPGSRWGSFVRRYGWRAYALPILTVITIAALVHTAPGDVGSGPTSAGAATLRLAAGTASSGGAAPARVEGAADTRFAAGATPAPVVIRLKGDATSCLGNDYDHLVVVSLSKQQLWACEGQKQVRSAPVTTGKLVDHDQTPVGSWRVQAKQRDRYLVGPGYKDYVRYWVPFNGDFGLHDASWQTMPFGSQGYKRRGSHGCVHLPTPTMAWLYHWTTVNRTVVTVEA